jgi:hypothetical protein
MGRGDEDNFSKLLVMAACATILLLASSCSINVRKEPNGQDKQVDINTLAGSIHVSKQADVSDIGLTVYPGAHLKEKPSGDDKSANVNLSGFGYGIKVIALEYESADAPGKVISFYKDQLKKYGSVLECHTSTLVVAEPIHTKNESNQLTCEGESGSDIELKVGLRDDQHIVAVEPDGNGSSFSLVYVRTHGKDADI